MHNMEIKIHEHFANGYSGKLDNQTYNSRETRSAIRGISQRFTYCTYLKEFSVFHKFVLSQTLLS